MEEIIAEEIVVTVANTRDFLGSIATGTNCWNVGHFGNRKSARSQKMAKFCASDLPRI